jgi:1,4-dihydroxy-2-naphthoate octaprenyltransferase
MPDIENKLRRKCFAGIHPWLMATRPKTLPAAVIPVLVGTAFAWRDGFFYGPALAVCLAFALLVQVGTNYANDAFDFLHGADREDRQGPRRAVVSGMVSARAMVVGTFAVFLTAFLVGLILVAYRGPELLVVGIASILFGFAYTGGPFPLAYRGLGDVFVLGFFGLVAVGGTYYVMSGIVSGEVLVAAVPIGLLATNILVVNNYRDMDTDARAGKRTLVVRFGRAFARRQYIVSLTLAFLVPLGLAWFKGAGWVALPLLSIPLGIWAARRLDPERSANELNGLLATSAGLLIVYGILFSVGVVL